MMTWHLICMKDCTGAISPGPRSGKDCKMFTNVEFRNFEDAAGSILEFIQQRYGFRVCMVTRMQRDRWTVLRVEGESDRISVGDDFNWHDSICSRMIRDEGPRIAPRISDVPAYVDAPMRSRFDVKSYIGIPVQAGCGKFIGTLCAIDDAEHPELDDSELPLLELLAALLAGYVRQEIASNELERRNERFRFEAMTDALTHLPNRRAWQEKIAKEQQRSIRLGDTRFICVVELTDLAEINEREGFPAGDELLRRTALILRYAVRNSDFVARVGGDEFTILGIQCDSIESEEVSERIRSSLSRADISAAVGTSVSRPTETHDEVWKKAGLAMCSDRRTGRRAGCRSS